jgi:hypothetical protein
MTMQGEKIYEYEVNLTGVADYGITLEAILSGEAPVPPQGVRLDAAFDGHSSGRLSGRVHGTDFLCIRADGRMDLDIRAAFETDDGHRIALSACGVCVMRADEPVGDLSENVSLTTAAEAYAWVNNRQVWATGTVNLTEGKVRITGYMQ